jgi:hypothetical protein
MTEGPRNLSTIHTVKYYVNRQQADMIVPLWRRGYDTKTIAESLGLPEYAVAKQLAEMRDRSQVADAQ